MRLLLQRVFGTHPQQRRGVLLMGSSGGMSARETWAWAGGAWSRLSPATQLPALAIAGTA